MEDIERTTEPTEQAEPETQPKEGPLKEEEPEEGGRPGRRRRPRKPKERKMVGYGRLAFEAMPEIMSYMFMAAVILTGASALGGLIISKLLEENGIFAITTANVKDFVSSWRILPILLVAAVLLLLNLILGVFGSIYQCDDILKGGKVTFIEIFRESFKDLKRFLNLSGFLVILYMVLGVPIVGFGFQVDMTQNLVIPNFILSVILSKWYLAAGYYALIIF
ncbi:MAG: glycerophosphoryl diester phosphodiesterase membrane domain-containing protein, partial [Lachnospiraceae bacterium]|nr:glycerophosphoryl diester phosphodiesterase membrane domain-containing protein [Lachnospiraceae bacterium]